MFLKDLDDMTSNKTLPNEETLDPQDWESMRELGHRMIDDVMDDLKELRNRPAWKHAPDKVRANFKSTPPLDPQSPVAIYEEYLEYIRPYPLGNYHPRWWGWAAGTGTVIGAFAELLAAATNTPSGAFSYMSSNYVEDQVLNWFKVMLGFPEESSGIITSGCSASNLIGLAIARNAKAGYDLRQKGLRSAPKEMTIYASTEIHFSIRKALELLGLGSDSMRYIPVNNAFQIDLRALEAAIKHDRERGYFPFCVIGAAGTINTGAIDNLNALADICQEEDLWFHIDGAFGAWTAIAPESKHLVVGMERADSLAFDLHKWMYLPYDIGGLLVRSEADHRKTFAMTATYTEHGEGTRGLTGVDVPWMSDYGFQLSRSFPALKAWMTIKEHGVRKYRRLIQQNIDQAHYLAGLVEVEPDLEMALPVSLNVVCFRYIKSGLLDSQLDELNKHIEIELQEQGIAVPSIVIINNKKYLHIAITNHRSRREDFEILVREVIRFGRKYSKTIFDT